MTTHTRYYAASDGKLTVFRGTSRPEGYRYAIWEGVHGIQFTNSAKPGCHAAVQITRDEYRALTAAKQARMQAEGRTHGQASPSECWVRNADVEVQAYLAAIRVKDAAEGIE